MPVQGGWNVPNYWADLREVGRRMQRGLSARPARPGAPSLFGLQNSGAAPWEAPARAQQAPPAGVQRQGPPVPAGLPDRRAVVAAQAQQSGPGMGGTTAIVVPPQRARQERLNEASQQAGGANRSQPLVPKEQAVLEAMARYERERSANPLAAVPELIDQRSAAYAERADIKAWMEAQRAKGPAGEAMVQRFLDKQRHEATAVQEMPAGAKLMGGDGSEQGGAAYDAARLAAYEKGGAPQRDVEAAMVAFTPRDLARNPLVNPVLTPEGSGQAFQAAANGMEFVPQASAQAGNLAYGPLPQASAAQGQMDFEKAAQMKIGDELLKRFKGQALAFNPGAGPGWSMGG